ncbi:MAG: hypothetical protein RL173_1621 [Fibrobacterota bacterium]|jgi:branched-chain amino acid transport system substrate-binding protein
MISIATLVLTLASAPNPVAELRGSAPEQVLSKLSDSSEASAFLRAEMLLRAGRAQEAQAAAQEFETEFPGSILGFRSRLIDAWSSLALGDQRRGCQILTEVVSGSDRVASAQARETLRDWAKSGKLAAEEMLALPSRLPLDDSLVANLAAAFETVHGKSPLVVILPTTGAYAPIGKRVARGAALAAQEAAVKMIQIDEPPDPMQAAFLVRGLLRVVRPRAVVGPLLSNTAAAVAQEMARWAPSVPLLLPAATSPGVSRLAPSAWQVNVTTAQQGIEAARRAKNCLGASEAYVLWPKGDFGDAVSDGFRTEFVRLGGRIAWQKSYNAGSTDFRAQLEALRRTAADLARRRGQDTVGLTPLVFSPGESSAEASSMGGQASAVGLKPLWIGASGWHSRQFLLETAGRMDGALVVTDNVPDENRPSWKTFAQKWRGAGTDAPDRLAALGWDATQLALMPRLPTPVVHVGAQADIELDPLGRNNVRVEVLRVEKGSFVSAACNAK